MLRLVLEAECRKLYKLTGGENPFNAPLWRTDIHKQLDKVLRMGQAVRKHAAL